VLETLEELGDKWVEVCEIPKELAEDEWIEVRETLEELTDDEE
jgi:hypothetical protein